MRPSARLGVATICRDLIALLVLLHEPAAAQRWQLDASGTRVRFDTITTLSSASVAPFVEWQRRGVFAALSGSVTGFEGAEWAAQGRGDLSLLINPFRPLSPFRFEVVGMAAGTYHPGGFRTAATRGELRFHVTGRHGGGWAGAVGGTGWTSAGSAGEALATAVGASTGVWGHYGRTRAAVMFTPLRFTGYWFPIIDARLSSVGGPLDLAAYGGWRGGPVGSGIDATAWGGGTVAWWVTSNVALFAAGGSYASDLLQGLPSGRYIAGGLRLANRRPPAPSVRPLGRPLYEREDGSGLLRFNVSGANRVEVVGDWNQWQPIAMRRASDGAWVLPVALLSGVYRFNLVVNGERWIVPEGVATVDDGYGGKTGVLIVP